MNLPMKWIKFSLKCILLIGVILFISSPYKFDSIKKKQILSTSIIINSPVEKVFNYLGNSKNAAKWSTYVDHITSLNSDFVADGIVGGKRRCFKQANEKGIQWDEEILEIQLNKRRTLSIYNPKNFPLFADGLITEQEYQKINNNKMKLTFTLFFKKEVSWFSNFKLKMSALYIKITFDNNLENIKNNNEEK